MISYMETILDDLLPLIALEIFHMIAFSVTGGHFY